MLFLVYQMKVFFKFVVEDARSDHWVMSMDVYVKGLLACNPVMTKCLPGCFGLGHCDPCTECSISWEIITQDVLEGIDLWVPWGQSWLPSSSWVVHP